MSGRIYDQAVWERLRRAILSKEPLCRQCKRDGVNEKATEVDHIVPLSQGGRPYHVDNLQPLCKPCHSRKTAAESKGRRRKPPRRTDERGYPTPEYLEWKRHRAEQRVR